MIKAKEKERKRKEKKNKQCSTRTQVHRTQRQLRVEATRVLITYRNMQSSCLPTRCMLSIKIMKDSLIRILYFSIKHKAKWENRKE